MDGSGATLVSGEGVALELPTAGLASRAVAVLLDLIVQFVALIVALLITALVAGGSDSDAFGAVVLVEVVLVVAGYPIVLEWLARGRTIGKMAVGLRVVRDDGGPIAFRQALVRGLAGLVLEKPGLLAPLSTFAAMATLAGSSRDKRIGDMMAGTVVLNERAAPQPTASPPPWVLPALQPWAFSLDLQRLDDRLALSVRQFVSRAYEMTPAGQAALGDELRRRVLAVVTPAPPPGIATPTLLVTLLAERRRRAGGGLPATYPPAAPWPAQSPSGYPPAAPVSGYAPAQAPAGGQPWPTRVDPDAAPKAGTPTYPRPDPGDADGGFRPPS